MSDDLFKPNATKLERALGMAVIGGGPDLTPVSQLMNPETCPEALLPWLAWAFSVDVWEPRWPLAQRRAAVAEAVALHRVKGTKSSAIRALRALGIEPEISEWFEYGGPPFTFRVVARPTVDLIGDETQPFLSAPLRDQIEAVLEATKPVRAHMDLTFLLRLTGDLGLAAALAARSRATAVLTPAIAAHGARGLTRASAWRFTHRRRLSMAPTLAVIAATRLAPVATFRATTRIASEARP